MYQPPELHLLFPQLSDESLNNRTLRMSLDLVDWPNVYRMYTRFFMCMKYVSQVCDVYFYMRVCVMMLMILFLLLA